MARIDFIALPNGLISSGPKARLSVFVNISVDEKETIEVNNSVFREWPKEIYDRTWKIEFENGTVVRVKASHATDLNRAVRMWTSVFGGREGSQNRSAEELRNTQPQTQDAGTLHLRHEEGMRAYLKAQVAQAKLDDFQGTNRGDIQTSNEELMKLNIVLSEALIDYQRLLPPILTVNPTLGNDVPSRTFRDLLEEISIRRTLKYWGR